MFRKLFFATILASAALAACATDQDQVGDGTMVYAPIQSGEDLTAHLSNVSRSPLDRLSPKAKQRFLDSLVFTDSGLGGYRYADLEAELSPTEIYEVLSLFGVEHTTSMLTGARVLNAKDKAILEMRPREDDHKGYKCSGPGSCYTDTNSICTSNC